MKAPCFDTNVKVEYPLGVKQAVFCSLSSQGSLQVRINNLGSKQCPGFLRLGTRAPPRMSVPQSLTRAGNSHPSNQGAMAEPLNLVKAPPPWCSSPSGNSYQKGNDGDHSIAGRFSPRSPDERVVHGYISHI